MRRHLGEHLRRIPLQILYRQRSGELNALLAGTIDETYNHTLIVSNMLIAAVFTPLATALLTLIWDWRLGLILLISIARALLKNAPIIILDEPTAAYNAAREQVNIAVVEFVQAMPVVRTFDGGETSFGRYQRALDNYLAMLIGWYRSVGNSARSGMLILNPMPTLVVLLWAGFYWWQADALPFATWLAVLLIGTGMAEALLPYISLYHLIEQGKISAERIIEVLDAPVLPVLEPPQTPKDASVSFHHVHFRYPGRTENALTDISFTAPAGSLTALVGSSGAGKTTVARLIPRFWDVDSGEIRIGGADIRHLAPEALMAQVAFVFQDNFLFSGTIADNIRLGTPDASDAEVETADRAAQCHDFIMTLPEGYQTAVGERGATLSGGERQRITIARAILQNRPILILDETTAFADAENEALLMRALAALMQDKTVLMIAHRLATIRHAAQILVFDHGQLVEQGDHASLIAQNGRYARLWQAGEAAQHWRIGSTEQKAGDAVL